MLIDDAISEELVTNGLVGRFIGLQIMKTSGTYVPTPGTKWLIVECVGGGGGGGGSQASAAGSCSVGSGGSEGCYGKSLFENTDDSYSVIVGAGGATAVGAAGGQGGTTSFGELMVADGGLGGGVMGSGTAVYLTGITGNTIPEVTGANITSSRYAGSFIYAVRLNSTYLPGATAGAGGRSVFGDGGGAHTSTGAGSDARSFGAGGSGAKSGGNNAADVAYAGGRGGDGVVMVWEYA
ncbi:hypothetical protein [Trabulsiella odontotermitis]|uniref:glycine-rich domain-containing protein n=1 Tax=Trabulsiella odontotermitis TaxID=379893 RepID=UPI0006765178|nr:hypothetical protein [Trabulsiella odontotermitis]